MSNAADRRPRDMVGGRPGAAAGRAADLRHPTSLGYRRDGCAASLEREPADPHYNPMGAKGAGEIGIVGVAAAIASAVYHATGIRIRDLPIPPDKLLA